MANLQPGTPLHPNDDLIPPTNQEVAALQLVSWALQSPTLNPVTVPPLTAFEHALFWIAQARCMAADLFTNVFPFTRKGREESSLSVTGGAEIPPIEGELVEDAEEEDAEVAMQGVDLVELAAVAGMEAEVATTVEEVSVPEAELEAVEVDEEEAESPTMNLVQSSWAPRLAIALRTG